MPAQTPPGYQGVDAFGLPSYSAYAPPTQQFTLASRGARLGATILDGLAAFAIIAVPMFIGALLDESTGRRDTFQPIFTVLGYVAYISILIYFLTVEGTTLGKKALGLRIVKEDTLQNGGFVTNCIMRGLIPGILGAITCNIFTLVDILFIFSQEQKCLHDQIAGTIVIEQATDYLKLN